MVPDTRNAWIPWGQWLAVAAMTLEHIARFALPPAWGLAPWATLLGRIAFPLFAAMVAWHAAHNTRDPMAYALRLLTIAVIAQLPYTLVRDVDSLNVVFTLAAGLIAASCLQRPNVRNAALLVVLVALGTVAGPRFEYGHLGLLLVPAFVLAVTPWPSPWQPIAAIPALLIGATLNHALFFNLVSLATVLGLLLLLVRFSQHVLPTLAPMPRPLWLAWYPLHFALIACLSWLSHLP
ncbi:TraX [Billgrantia azerbaijanica]|nr:TraX [Halomonas azerbaijanica]